MRRTRGPRGLMVTGFAAAALVAIAMPQIAKRVTDQPLRVAQYAETVRLWGPAVLLMFAIASALSARGLYFKPAEIDFLFAAPVTRRQLLLYSVVSRLGIAAFSALWMALFMTQQTSHWYAAIAGLFLAITFVQLAAQTSGLALANVSERLTKPLRRAGTVAFLSLVIGGFLVVGALLPRAEEVIALVRATVAHPVMRRITVISRPMVELFIAEDLGAFLFWLGAAGLVLIAMVGAMMLLDVAYLEASLGASARLQEKLRRLRMAGGPGHATERTTRSTTRRRHLVMPARLGGMGPTAWRQVLAMGRAARSLVVTIVIAVLATLVPLLVLSTSTGTQRGFGPALIGALVLTPMMSQHFAFDFRRDLDRMAFLKSLPLSPLAVAAGQLVPATLLFSLLQFTMLAAIVLASHAVPVALALTIAILMPFVNWIVAAIDNVLFLLMPYRLVPEDPGAMPFMGRLMLAMVLKGLAVLVIASVSGTIGVLLWRTFNGSIAAGALGAGAVLVLAAIALTALVGRTFAAFDVSRDVPG